MAADYYSLTLADVSPFLSYEPATGVFRWLVRRGRGIRAGDIAGGYKADSGYVHIRLTIEGRQHQLRAHRLAWLFTYGAWPDGEVDHINGNRSDTRIANLRLATASQNQQNSKRSSTNTSGVKGVSWDRQHQRWAAYIWLNNRKIFLGRFDSLEEAAWVRIAAAMKLHGDFARLE